MAGRNDVCGLVGTSFTAKRWLSLDICGFLGITLSWGVHAYALYVLGAYTIENSLASTVVFFSLYIPIALLALSSLYMAWTTDPGAVPLGARPLTIVRRANSGALSTARSQARGTRRCPKCHDNYKPPRAHHDSVTGRCVVKFDHFCPWVGNAVGAMNHKYFCLFLLYTCLACLTSLLLLLLRVIHCGYVRVIEEHEGGGASSSTGQTSSHEEALPAEPEKFFRPLHRFLDEDNDTEFLFAECNDFYSSHWVLGLVIVSLVFLVFTCSMGCEQMEAIETGQSKIARMKMRVGQTGTEFSRVTEGFNEMFGGSSPRVAWHWFNPWQGVRYPRGMEKVVLGYDWDVTFTATPYQEDAVASVELQGMEGGREVQAEAAHVTPPDTAPPIPSTVVTQDVEMVRHTSDISVQSNDENNSGRERISRRKPSPVAYDKHTIV
ncbi:predicted protein [Phaeodactylum tricornutum CCAP 1055/1]|jgi:hypothetical protein|uniref:Palmitoyltransferase n=2 Tax=Phaeodactylum tricornutum TaxID=2850 RepID=B7G050_PHATC|nr:predicted protein [Phaeodactylum tricornutum CCAP 1055/1]EEC47823.1 predicted protein [Phaeodactylum tricornutum CCAP 1055/1]|eukprot:XP_002180415.1 predicted protein [Phaeodactylum tricornutum CCAP 1055/1]